MATAKRALKIAFTVPGMTDADAKKVISLLQDRLNALSDLALTLKHIHWNVVGPNFIAVHLMLDPQVDAVRLMADETAERSLGLVRLLLNDGAAFADGSHERRAVVTI